MKKIIITGLSVLLYFHSGIAQSTTATNSQVFGQPRYLGFSNDFEVRLRSNNINRMITAGGTTASNQGYVAFGNNLPNNFAPQSRLHLYQTDGFNNLRFTTNGTGHTAADGFQIGLGNTGDVAFINNELNQNFSWYNQGGGAPGTLLGRMRLYDGGVGQTTGRLLIGNDLSANYVPQARLHMVQFGTGTNNSMLRTDGVVTNLNTWSMWLGTNENTVQEQFRISNQVTGNAQNSFRVGTIVNKSLKFTTEDSTRVIILGRTNIFYERDGFTGFNNLNPLFHIDVRTQNPTPNPNLVQRGELIFRGRIVDDPNAYISFINIAGGDSLFMPTLFGNQSNKDIAGGLNTLGSIVDAQDINANNHPVTRFISGKDYNPVAPLVNPDLTLDRNNVVVNRRIFGWNNSHDELMTMRANGFLGVGTITPGNRVEINSDYYEDSTLNPAGTWTGVFQNFNPTTPNGDTTAAGLPATGFSGLRFSDLTAISVPQINPGIGVLALDSLGDVIYVPSTGIGNYCGLPQNSLTANYEIAMGDFSLYMHGIRNKVFVGDQICNAASDSRFTVDNNSFSSGSQIAIKGISTGNAGSVGGRFEGARYGVFSLSSGGFAFGSGVLGQSQSATTTNIGGDFSGANGVTAIGVRGTSFGGASFNYGVYGSAPFSNNGSSTAFPTNAAVYAQGDLVATGTSYFAQQQQVSDQMFKTNVVSVTNAMDIIDQLNPVSYEYLNNFGDRINFKNGTHFGFIAQEVEQIIPELVSEGHLAPVLDSNGIEITPALPFKSMDYNGLFSILTQGIKEQQHVIHTQDSIITDLNTRLTTLENCLSGILPFLCQLSNSSIQQNDEQTQQNIIKELKVQLDNSQSIVLGQNVPNPFAEQTVIEYYIPEAVKQAQIIFYNQTGQIINTVNIEEMGNGRLTVFANDLSTGIYTYTLVADGQIIATKKMVKTK